MQLCETFILSSLLEGGTVTRHCCLKLLTRLPELFHPRSPELWPDALILHHDSASGFDMLASRRFMAETR